MNFKLILKTFFSNDACIEASCTKKIVTNIFAIIFALMSFFFIPLSTVININKSKGSDWINKQIYNYDFYDEIADFSREFKKEKLSIEKNKKNELILKENKKELKKEYSWKSNNLTIYFTRETDKYNSFCEDKKKYKTTFIVFGKKELSCYFFNQKNNYYEGQLLPCDYKNIDLNDLNNLFNKEYNKGENEIIKKKINIFFDNIYENQKNKIIINELINESLIITLTIFFSGLIIWFLSHTKNNLYRIHSFWTSQKIMFYMSLTPSIISFLFGNMVKSIFLFIILIAIRIQLLNKIFKNNH